jgi:methylenetetrahydrofolate reductase (NADPH)
MHIKNASPLQENNMKIKDILNHTKITFSFEFFPPKTETGWEKLFHTIKELIPLAPSWVSVTYGAGGSTRERTHDLVLRIQKETDLTVVSHLTCVGSRKNEIRRILEKYSQSGVNNILALRGDLPAEQNKLINFKTEFKYANELVVFIKKSFPDICIGVAGFPEGHPDSVNRLKEIEYLKAKVEAGADYIITQLFFDNKDFYDFCERCELAGINVPIIAGLMVITSNRGMHRITELAARTRIPAPLLKAVYRTDSDEYVEKVGIHWATEQVRDLIDNKVKGVHFYTLNTSRASLQIYQSLGVKNSDQLAK